MNTTTNDREMNVTQKIVLRSSLLCECESKAIIINVISPHILCVSKQIDSSAIIFFFSSHSLVFFCLDRDNNASMLCNSSFVRRQLYECESSLIFESFHSNGFTLLSAPTHETAEYALFVCTHLNARMADARRKGIATKKMMAFFVFIISILCVSLHLPLTWNGNRIRPKVTVMKCYSIFSDAFGVVLILP